MDSFALLTEHHLPVSVCTVTSKPMFVMEHLVLCFVCPLACVCDIGIRVTSTATTALCYLHRKCAPKVHLILDFECHLPLDKLCLVEMCVTVANPPTPGAQIYIEVFLQISTSHSLS